eukprot:TRINITY_DN51119_c0_g1_i1.p1 TRINITY_DN51119_c0_g1~~TRINITY_DN51119_c0_g1_i1.p1  ORF type:complete len:352 (+),score=65.51 TRINITY_DN51119_c0_g1_i1:46-1101(+)
MPGSEEHNGHGAKRPLVLDTETYLQRAKAARLERKPEGHCITAMYSSLVDGIVTDPELMVLPLDDHALVRGHAVFDTCTLAAGRVYRLAIHLDRLFKSAELARLRLPFGSTQEANRKRITEIVCETCLASGLRDGGVRFFLSAGPGNFGFTPSGCTPSFFCVVYPSSKSLDAPQVISEVTVPSNEIPMKPKLLATLKSNNYLLNCMLAMAAQEKGGTFGITIRDDDTVAEGCVANCALVTKDNVLITPPFSDILCGTTVRKAMELSRQYLVGKDKMLRDVKQEAVTKSALFEAAEVLMLCGDLGVFAVTKLDGKTIGDGQTGPVAREVLSLIRKDVYEGQDEHIDIEKPSP